MSELKFETLQIHAGQVVDPATNARAVPIYQTSSYVFNNSKHGSDLFNLRDAGNIYSRIMNPTDDVLEKRIAALEGGVGALTFASGAAATTAAIQNIAYAGDNIVAAATIYGGTYNLFAHTLPKYGITTTFVQPNDFEGYRAAVNDKTKAIFIESLGNPNSNIIDIEAVAKIAHDNKIPLIVDNTFATPYLLRPFDYGADIVIHSATKFIGGHGTTIGGLLVDSGKFDWAASGRFANLTTPDPSYHGIVYTDAFGPAAYIFKARVQFLRDTGACLAPFNAFLLLQGLETLSLRVERHVSNGLRVAQYLAESEYVEAVNHPLLPSSPDYALAQKYFPRGAGSIFTFNIKGGAEEATAFIDHLKIFSLLANVADAKSLVIHPASTTHSQLNEEELAAGDIAPNTVRLSVGLENIDDLLADIEQALEAVYNA